MSSPVPPIHGSESNISISTINLRLNAVRESVNRGRYAFLASTIASLAILIAAWNAYGSWYRSFALRPEPYAGQGTSVVDEAQKQLISEWIKNQTIAISPIGIRVGISDAAIIGALGLWVITIWLYFSIRRANRTIGFLLFDTKAELPEIQKMIFHGIAAHLVFSDIGQGDQKVDNLKTPPSTTPFPYVRKAVRFLFYLPVVTIFSTVLLDLISIYPLQSVFRPGHLPLWYELKSAEPLTWLQVIVWEGIAMTLGVFTFILCRKIVSFEDAIGKVIQEYLALPGLKKLMNQQREVSGE